MELVIGILLGVFVGSGFGFITTRESGVKARIIQDAGFCVQTQSTGLNFKKCYELKEITNDPKTP